LTNFFASFCEEFSSVSIKSFDRSQFCSFQIYIQLHEWHTALVNSRFSLRAGVLTSFSVTKSTLYVAAASDTKAPASGVAINHLLDLENQKQV